jgi:hypothetical protein
MKIGSNVAAALLGATVGAVPLVAAAAETPKNGGILTYVIPADAPPSFDAHRETTAPPSTGGTFCCPSEVDPNNPSSTTDFVRIRNEDAAADRRRQVTPSRSQGRWRGMTARR